MVTTAMGIGRHSAPPRGRRRAAVLTLVAVAIAAVLAGLISVATGVRPASATSTVGGPITRSEVLARAQYWVDNPPGPYSESAYGPDQDGRSYRRDCSGFVSMAWHLTSSYNTSTLAISSPTNPNPPAYAITKDQLLPGDVLDATPAGPSGHVVLFAGWTDSSHTAYWGYEFGGEPPLERVIPYPYDTSDGRTFLPYRYGNIVDDTTPTPPPAPPVSASSVIRGADGTYHVFAINSSHHLMQGLYAGSGWSWQDLGGNVYGTPTVLHQGVRYDVWAPGGNGHMYQQTYNGSSWSGWFDIGGGNFADGAQVIVSPSGTYHLFATNTSHVVYQGFYTPGDTSWTWQSLGGSLVASPAVAYTPTSNRYDLFAPGTNGQLYQDIYNGSSWSGWTLIGGGNFTASPQVVVAADGSYHLFAINSSHDAYQGSYYGSGWSWQNLGGAVTGTPGVNYVASANRYDLFAPGLNGQLYQKTFSSNVWSNWSSIGGANFG